MGFRLRVKVQVNHHNCLLSSKVHIQHHADAYDVASDNSQSAIKGF